MSDHDKTADILFHAAIAVGASRKSTVVGAIMDAVSYLAPHDMWYHRSQAFDLYKTLFDHLGDAWPTMRGSYGGVWIVREHMRELMLTLLFAYEYCVQIMGAARSSADPCLNNSTLRPQDDEAFEALDQDAP